MTKLVLFTSSILLLACSMNRSDSKPCGFLVKNLKVLTNFLKDLHDAILSSIYFNHGSIQPVLLQNTLSTNNIVPRIFRTMKYDCFINIHCNLETYRKITYLSTLEYEDHLYTRGTFIVFILESDEISFRKTEILKELGIPHNLLFVRVFLTRSANYKIKVYTTRKYYFCVFCKPFLVILDRDKDKLSTKLTDYQTRWTNSYHAFEHSGDYEDYQRYFISCSKTSYVNFLHENTKFCGLKHIKFQTVVTFSKLNVSLTLMPGQNIKFYTPSMRTVTLSGKRKFWYHYSTPILHSFVKAGLIYCLRKSSEFQRRKDIWFMSVDSNVWVLMALTISGILCLQSSLSLKKLRVQLFLTQLTKNMLFIVRGITRQTISLRSTKFILLELICVILLITYENHITLELVTKREQRPYSELDDLYNNKYTFLLKRGVRSPGSIWLTAAYNTTNSCRVFEFDDIGHRFWIENLLWEQPNGIKYALLDPFYGNKVFEFVKAVSQHLYTCHKLYPKNPIFNSMATFYVFKSTLAEYFKESVSRLQASGIDTFIERTADQLAILKTYTQNRELEKTDTSRINAKKVQRINRYKNNMIQLKNCLSILYSSGGIIIVSILILVLEILIYRVRHVTKVKFILYPK